MLADHARQIRKQRETEDSAITDRLGKIIRRIRESANPRRSQQEMASALGITQTGYSRYEAGTVPITVPTLVRLCGVLGVKVADVLAEVLGGG